MKITPLILKCKSTSLVHLILYLNPRGVNFCIHLYFVYPLPKISMYKLNYNRIPLYKKGPLLLEIIFIPFEVKPFSFMVSVLPHQSFGLTKTPTNYCFQLIKKMPKEEEE
jgi:hypothetical protein